MFTLLYETGGYEIWTLDSMASYWLKVVSRPPRLPVGAHIPYRVTPRLVRKFVSGAMGQNSLRGVGVSQTPLCL